MKALHMTPRAFNVLFLCTGNSARSIMAESILKHEGADKFNVYSAGSNPKGDVHPLALETLAAFNFPTNGLRSKSWDEFATDNAPHFDFIFTVCDNAAGEACPVWAGKPVTAHWGIEDPAAVTGSEHEQRLAFTTAFRYLRTRISAFSALPLNQLDKAKISAQLNKIGQLEGATETKVTQP